MLVIGLVCLPSLLLPRAYCLACFRLYIRVARWGLRYICGAETEIRGADFISGQPTIVAAKHQSMWDTLFLHLIFDDLRIIMKRELRFYPIFGWYAWKLRQIPIDRGGTIRTLKLMTKEAQNVVQDGASVLIFPEGTRVKPGAAPAYHRAGLSSLYQALDLPITPVATNSGQCWPAKGIRRYTGKVVFEVLPEIPAGLPKKEMMAAVEKAIEDASNALIAENQKALP